MKREGLYPDGVEILPFVFMGQTGFIWACEKCHTPLQIVETRGYWACDCHPDAPKPWDNLTDEQFIERLHTQ